MKVWILTSEHNEYDQYGEYFLSVFKEKPTIVEIAEILDIKEINEFTEPLLLHILNGGGRRDIQQDFHVWYYLRETEAK